MSLVISRVETCSESAAPHPPALPLTPIPKQIDLNARRQNMSDESPPLHVPSTLSVRWPRALATWQRCAACRGLRHRRAACCERRTRTRAAAECARKDDAGRLVFVASSPRSNLALTTRVAEWWQRPRHGRRVARIPRPPPLNAPRAARRGGGRLAHCIVALTLRRRSVGGRLRRRRERSDCARAGCSGSSTAAQALGSAVRRRWRIGSRMHLPRSTLLSHQ